MAYTKTTWVDRIVQFANRYAKTNESSGSVDLTATPGTITQAGTPLSATNMNKIEQGIFDADAALTAHTDAKANHVGSLVYCQKNLGGF